MGVIEIFGICVYVFYKYNFKKIITVKGVILVFSDLSILFNVIIFFSIKRGYRDCLGFMCILF